MSADLNSYVKLKGTAEEKKAMLLAILKFEKDSNKQYKTKRDCGYISGSSISKMSDNEISTLAQKDEVQVEMGGPYGVFTEPSETPIFERIADAAPNASFEGATSGFVTGADVGTRAVLKDGKLTVTSYYTSDYAYDEMYEDEVLKKLPWSEFCKLFHIDPEVFDEDSYREWIGEYVAYGDFSADTTLDEFLELFDDEEKPDIDEDMYNEALSQFAEKGIMTIEDYRDNVTREPSSVFTYDPVTHKYIG